MLPNKICMKSSWLLVDAISIYHSILCEMLKKKQNYNLKKGYKCKIKTYLFLPRIGDSPMMTDAKADLTCWLASMTRSWTHGKMLFIITVSWTPLSRFWQKSRTLWAAAARTSASQSFNKLWNKNKNQINKTLHQIS